jgi:hypothetical protein
MQEFILNAYRDSDKNIVIESKNGLKFNMPTDTDSIRKIKQAVSFKQNVRAKMDNGSVVFGATKAMPTSGKPFEELMALAVDYVAAPVDVPTEQAELINFVHAEAKDLKPDLLMMNTLSWKYLVRSAMRGKNIMMT